VDGTTVYNWENNRASPSLNSTPKIIKFLGYTPPQPKTEKKTIGERLLIYRRIKGITQKELAKKLGVDPSTLARWERGRSTPLESSIKGITRFFKGLG